MRIAFLNTYGNGSTGKIVDSLKSFALKNGFEVLSFFSREYCATPGTSKRFFTKSGFYFDALMTRLFDNHGLNNKANNKRIIKNLKMFKPDIVHIHNLHGYWINYKLLFNFLKESNIKVVFTLHDCWPFTGHCTHFDYVKCEKWKTKCNKCPQKKSYPRSLFFDKSAKNFLLKKKAFTQLAKDQMTISVPSSWLKDIVSLSFLKEYNCLVINNGIDTDVFKPTNSSLRNKYGIGNKTLVLAVANYWDERKGLRYVFDCARKKPNWIFVYVGHIKNNSNQFLPNVIHIERTESQSELAAWYTTANVFLNPTLEDNYPTTNLEAYACHTPIVTFNTGGSPELIIKTGCGLVSAEKTTEALIESIEMCLAKKQLPRFDYEIVSKNSMLNSYLNLYNRMMGLPEERQVYNEN